MKLPVRRGLRAARELGIQTVAIYSEADKDSLHTMLADEAICIGPAKSTWILIWIWIVSYQLTIVTEGSSYSSRVWFLGENSKICPFCERNEHINLLIPSGEVMDKMGDKINARAEMIKANVPVIPGSKWWKSLLWGGFRVANRLGYSNA